MRKKRIKDYPEYDVYDDGRVYSHKRNKFLNPCKNSSGYDTVNLYDGSVAGRRSCSVHELVAEAFVRNPKHYSDINHKDHNKSNNRYDNLEWISHSENLQYEYDHGRHSKQKPVLCVTNGVVYRSGCEAERALGCDHRHISECCRGERPDYNGLVFEFH